MPRHRWTRTKRTLRRNPVLASMLAPVVVWAAARFGLHVDQDTAAYIAGLVLAAAAWYARSKVTPTAAPDPTWLRSRVRVRFNGVSVPASPPEHDDLTSRGRNRQKGLNP